MQCPVMIRVIPRALEIESEVRSTETAMQKRDFRAEIQRCVGSTGGLEVTACGAQLLVGACCLYGSLPSVAWLE